MINLQARVELERQLIGTLLSVGVPCDLDASQFVAPAHQVIYEAFSAVSSDLPKMLKWLRATKYVELLTHAGGPLYIADAFAARMQHDQLPALIEAVRCCPCCGRP